MTDCNLLATKKNDNPKRFQRSQEQGVTEVVTRSPSGRKTKSAASNLLCMHQRLHNTLILLLRGFIGLLEVSKRCYMYIIKLQIGFRLCSNRFHLDKGDDSLQPSGTHGI